MEVESRRRCRLIALVPKPAANFRLCGCTVSTWWRAGYFGLGCSRDSECGAAGAWPQGHVSVNRLVCLIGVRQRQELVLIAPSLMRRSMRTYGPRPVSLRAQRTSVLEITAGIHLERNIPGCDGHGACRNKRGIWIEWPLETEPTGQPLVSVGP